MNPSDDDQALLDLLDADIDTIESLIRERVGIQRYARLRLIACLIETLLLESGFTRSDARQICSQANLKTLDRALSDMESAGMVEIMAINDQRQRGGAVYRVCPPARWQLRDPVVAARRAGRSGRGGSPHRK